MSVHALECSHVSTCVHTYVRTCGHMHVRVYVYVCTCVRVLGKHKQTSCIHYRLQPLNTCIRTWLKLLYAVQIEFVTRQHLQQIRFE